MSKLRPVMTYEQVIDRAWKHYLAGASFVEAFRHIWDKAY